MTPRKAPASPRPRRRVWVLHGPNLNLLGRREPRIYGRETLRSIDERLQRLGERLEIAVESFQSNHEGALIDRLAVAMEEVDGCLLNPAAFSHTSLALADTLRSMTIPVVEVHMTNLYARDRERHTSLTGGAATGVIMGFGPASYELGLHALSAMIGSARGRGEAPMSLERSIRSLVRILREEDLAEIEVRRLFTTIRVRRPGAEMGMAMTVPAPAAVPATEPKEADASPAANLVPIKSPMVGTFYRSPAPDADPYVEENAVVDVGQTVCIVEAMKLMNEIESEVKGRIARILVENAQPVEYGQVLFLVEAESAA